MRPRVAGLSSSGPLVVWLTVVWVGLWGSVTAANVLGGLAVAVVLVVLLPLSDVPDRADVRVLPLLRFLGHFAVDLVVASWQVAVLAVRPGLHLRQAVVSVPVRGASDALLTLLADAISLTPGTLTLEVDRPSATLFVHVLDVGEGPDAVERMRTSLLAQEALAVRAIGSKGARRALDEDQGPEAGT